VFYLVNALHFCVIVWC